MLKFIEFSSQVGRLRFYIPSEDTFSKEMVIPERLKRVFLRLNVEIIQVKLIDTPGRLWRFMIGDDISVDRFLIRDSDDRLKTRDYACVQMWIKSKLPVLCMRDHFEHTWPIMAGMFGFHSKSFRQSVGNICWSEYLLRKQSDPYLCDQILLKEEIWPFVSDNLSYCCDPDQLRFSPGSYDFPEAKIDENDFVGARYTSICNPTIE